MQLTIMSFNVQHFLNYVTRKIDFDLFEQTVRQFDPDILGLNEVYGSGRDPLFCDQARVLADRLGYHVFFARAIDVGDRGPYGNALLSRYPILDARVIPVPDPVSPKGQDLYETRCLLQSHIDVPGGLEVNVIHMGLNADEQENAVRTVVEHVSPCRSVLMGDFNMQPNDENLQPLFRHMQDTACLFDENKLSYPSDVPSIKIDYILTGTGVAARKADIPAVVASDHRPYIAVVDI